MQSVDQLARTRMQAAQVGHVALDGANRHAHRRAQVGDHGHELNRFHPAPAQHPLLPPLVQVEGGRASGGRPNTSPYRPGA
jgi:hypothetical protein